MKEFKKVIPMEIVNIGNSADFNDTLSYQKEFPFLFDKELVKIFNVSIEDFKNLKNFSELEANLEKSDILFVTIENSQLYELGIKNFNMALEEIKVLQNNKNILVIPVILDAEETENRSDKYDSIKNFYFICKDKYTLLCSIEGILCIFSSNQMIGYDLSDFELLFRDAGRIAVDNYRGPKKFFSPHEFMEKTEKNSSGKLLVSIKGGDETSLTEALNITEKLMNEINITSFDSVSYLFSHDSQYSGDSVWITFYSGENEFEENHNTFNETVEILELELPSWITKK